jgi:hypothetical protein
MFHNIDSRCETILKKEDFIVKQDLPLSWMEEELSFQNTSFKLKL